MSIIQVRNKTTGEHVSIDENVFDPALHEVAEGQEIAVRPISGGEMQAIEATPRAIVSQEVERITGAEQAEATRQAVVQERQGGIGKGLQEFGRGVASGLTFGLSELALAPDTELKREEARERREVQATARLAGELIGGIAPSVLASGTGAFGAAARLTPTGRLAHNTARLVSGSETLAGRALRSGIGSALEGGAEFTGQLIANQTLSENPALSAEAVATALGQGLLFGGVVGGAAEGLGRALRRAETPTERFGREFRQPPEGFTLAPAVGEQVVPSRALTAADFEPPPFTVAADAVPVDALVSQAAKDAGPESYRSLVAHVDDDAARAFGAATDDLGRIVDQLDSLRLDDDIVLDVRTAVAQSANRYLEAGTRARQWLDDVGTEIGDPGMVIAKQLRDEIPEELEDQGIAALAELDEAGQGWRAISHDVQAGLADAIEQATREAAGGPTPAGLRERFAGIAQRARDGLRGGDVAAIVGAVEGARDLGVDVPLPSVRDIPILGEGVSLYTKFRAATRAVGVLPANPATRAARRVTTVQERLTSAVRNAGRKAAAVIARPVSIRATAATARNTARQVQELRERLPRDVESRAMASIDAPMAVKRMAAATAVRGHEYLLSVAPENPLEGTPASLDWIPTPQEQHEWRIRRSAVQNPTDAIRRSMAGGFPDLAIEAVREVYPALYEGTRQRLQQAAPRLQRRLPSHQLQAIGRVYRIPLTTAQSPGYGTAVQRSFARPAPQPRAAGIPPVRTPNPSTSPLGTQQAAPLENRM